MAPVLRFLRPPAGSFFLFGPRGTGKSTWLAKEFPGALRFDLLAPEVLRAYQARPERLRERIEAEPGVTSGALMGRAWMSPWTCSTMEVDLLLGKQLGWTSSRRSVWFSVLKPLGVPPWQT